MKNNLKILNWIEKNKSFNNSINTSPMSIKITDDEYIDHDREIKDICTKFVVDEMFKTDESIFNFMNLILTHVVNGIYEYKNKHSLHKNSILFLYKGGNVLRIIQKEFDEELPAIAAKVLEKFYSNDFKRSDADFSIYIDPKLNNFNDIVNDITKLCYLWLDIIRNDMMNNPSFYFDFYKYNPDYKQIILNNYLETFQNASCLNDKSNPKYFNKKILDINFDHDPDYQGITDKYIRFNKSETEILINEITNKTHSIYCSENRALKFKDGNNQTIHFNLCRAKFCFNLIMGGKDINIKKIGGELIDISIPLDNGLHDFFNALNYSTFSLKYQSSDLIFQSYNSNYLLTDLEHVILTGKPWERNKYAKRLNRLMYLYFVDMFIKSNSQSTRLNYLKNLQKILSNITVINPLDFMHSINKIINKCMQFRIYKLIQKIVNLYRDFYNDPQFIDFINVIVINLNTLCKCIDNILEFYSLKNIDENELYKGEIKYSLI